MSNHRKKSKTKSKTKSKYNKKYKKSGSRKKRTQRRTIRPLGGVWPLVPELQHIPALNEKLKMWQPLYVHSGDCVTNACAALGLLPRELAIATAAATQSGVLASDLLQFLDERFPDKHEIINITSPEDFMKKTTEWTIIIGMLWFSTADGWHAVLIIRVPEKDGSVILFDPQNNIITKGWREFEDYRLTYNLLGAIQIIKQKEPDYMDISE